ATAMMPAAAVPEAATVPVASGGREIPATAAKGGSGARAHSRAGCEIAAADPGAAAGKAAATHVGTATAEMGSAAAEVGAATATTEVNTASAAVATMALG